MHTGSGCFSLVDARSTCSCLSVVDASSGTVSDCDTANCYFEFAITASIAICMFGFVLS